MIQKTGLVSTKLAPTFNYYFRIQGASQFIKQGNRLMKSSARKGIVQITIGIESLSSFDGPFSLLCFGMISDTWKIA